MRDDLSSDMSREMEGLEESTEVSAPVREEWDASITRQVPDEEIDWVGLGDPDNRGRVVFEDLTGIEGPRTRVTVMLDYETDGPVEKIGDAMGLVRRRVQGDLVRFKEFIEARGSDVEGWRGEIHAGETEDSASSRVRRGLAEGDVRWYISRSRHPRAAGPSSRHGARP